VIFDIDSHLGFFTKYCLEQNPTAEIYAFEPQTDLVQRAKEALPHSNIHRNNLALRTHNGELDFFVNTEKNMQ